MDASLQPGDHLPDVAIDRSHDAATALAWVGMSGLHVPLRLDTDPAKARGGLATVNAWVNLPAAVGRGIHMSRLYAQCEEVLASQPLTRGSLEQVLRGFLDSHAGISTEARVELRFEVLARRRALLSDRHGWKVYPCRLDARLTGQGMTLDLESRIGYSSTCPASAALARQLVQQRFAQAFSSRTVDSTRVHAWLGTPEGMCATPHGQRSEARIRVRLGADDGLPLIALADAVEGALKTPLQTAVKRQDEQEFARLNGANLMFCEDAARRIHAVLDADPRYLDFAIRCAHFESLHPHDAVAMAVKGIAGGYRE